MMRRVAGDVLRAALAGRDAGIVRARLAHQLPPVVVVGLDKGASLTRRENERWGGSHLHRDARLGEVRGYIENDDSNAERSTTDLSGGRSHSCADSVRGGVLHTIV
jgi:hypothetical protein